MHTKSTLALMAIAMAGGSFAFNHHRHLDAHAHAHLQKVRHVEERGLHTHVEWVTVYETVTVYKNRHGEIKTASPDTYFANEKPDEVAPAVASPEAAPPAKEAVAVSPASPPPAADSAQPASTPAPAAEDRTDGSDVSAAAEPAVQAAPAVPIGGKRGFAYNDCGLVNNFATGGGKALTWAYNWDSHHNGLTAPVDFVPMLWGDIEEHTKRWKTNADKMIASGSTHLLSFNEPDHPHQANMSPESAASAHVKYMNPYAGVARIGSPAITNSNLPGQSVQWLTNWVKACKSVGCHFDFCAVHWYSQASTPVEEVAGFFRSAHEACEGKPIWITEFAPSGSDEEVAEFLRVNLKMFDDTDYIERYSYFMMSVGKLMSSPSTPSNYGATYFGLS